MRTGFSLDDVRGMSVADTVAFADVAAEAAAPSRRATQEDIDRLLA